MTITVYKKIPDLTAAGAPDGTELLEAVQGGISKKMTAAQIASLAPAPIAATVSYAPAGTGLVATDVQAAITELDARSFQILREDGVNASGAPWNITNNLTMQAVGAGTTVFGPGVGGGGPRTLLKDTVYAEAVTTGAINQAAGARLQTAALYGTAYRRTAGSAKGGGFLSDMLFGYAEGNVASQRCFHGFQPTAAGPSLTVDPSTYLNMVGVGKDAADTNLFFMTNDGAGAATKVNLGVTFISLVGKLLRLRILAPVGGATVVCDLHNIDDNVHYTTTFSADLAAVDVPLYAAMLINTGANALNLSIRNIRIKLFQNYI